MGFELDRRIAAASVAAAQLGVCEARLQNDMRWSWIVLVPRRAGLRELEELDPADRALVFDEVLRAGRAVRAIGDALGRPVEKLNVGALGNVVSQLHLHVVGRRADDPAWPGPVWGFGEAAPYPADALARACEAARRAFSD